MFNITKICPDILDTEYGQQEILESEGKQMAFDTRNILNNIELEQLTADDIEDI